MGVPRVETWLKPWASMRPTLSRLAAKNCFLFIFASFWPTSDNSSPLWLWCLIFAVRGPPSGRNDQTPKSVTLLSAQGSWFKANNGINGRGPPEAGRMPFMPAVSLNQWSGALPTWSCFNRFFLLSFFFSVFAAACSAGSIFWLSTTSAVRTRASVGARFKLLSVGAGSKHGDLCNEQISDSNERFNLNRGGSMTTQAQGQTRAVAAKKVHLRNPSGGEMQIQCFFWSSFSLFSWLVDCTA